MWVFVGPRGGLDAFGEGKNCVPPFRSGSWPLGCLIRRLFALLTELRRCLMRRSLNIGIGFNGRGCDRLDTVGLE